MDDEPCRQFFLQPQATFHRRYEVLRAYFLDGRPLSELAERFGYRMSALKSMVCRFRASCLQDQPAPFFFPMDAVAPQVAAVAKMSTDPKRRTLPTPTS